MTSMNPNDVVIDIKAKLDKAVPPMTCDCCIYRVPFDIRRLNEDAYTPRVVSIGPFHHGHPRLHNMERHKLIYCKKFLKRAQAKPETLIRRVQDVEPSVRRFYSDTIDLTKEEHVEVIFVDSCFLFELFWRDSDDELSDDDTSLSKPWLKTNIGMDLLLLENQLPFFVLDKLFNQAFPGTSFRELTFNYFDDYKRSDLTSENITSIRHFTDLLRTFHLPPPLKRPHRDDAPTIHFPSATELLEAGVRFEVNTEKTESKCLLDLGFSGRVLKIPQLKVEDCTETLFRNLVALEQCHYPRHSYITDYVAVLDFLINTSRDVDVLVQRGILVNWLGDSDSVANLFNGLWKNITHSNFNSDYIRLCKDLNAFCKDPWHKLKATLRRDYCRSPWQTAASIAGIVLLVLSLLQSVCSVIQVVQQAAPK